MKRAIDFGVTQAELDRAVAMIKSYINSEKLAIDKYESSSYATNIYKAFFKQTKVVDNLWELNYEENLLSNITKEDIKTYLSGFNTDLGIVVGITGTNNYKYPKEKEVIALLEKVKAKKLTPYVEEGTDLVLFDKDVKGGTVVKTKDLKVDGKQAKEFTLSNGIKVVTYTTDFEKEWLSFNAYSPGGESLLSKDLLINNAILPSLISESGLGDLNSVQLQKYLAGKTAFVSAGVSKYSEVVSGGGNIKDLEIMFQLIYLNLTAPRFDNHAFNRLLEAYNRALEAKGKNITSRYNDALNTALANHNDRFVLLNKDFINQLSIEKTKEVFKQRFSKLSDFTFVFVGDFNTEKLVSLATKYLGGLPTVKGKEKPINHNHKLKQEKVKVWVNEAMETPQTSINITLSGAMKYSKLKSLELSVLAELLNKKLMDRIREDEGGSYGTSVVSQLYAKPLSKYKF